MESLRKLRITMQDKVTPIDPSKSTPRNHFMALMLNHNGHRIIRGRSFPFDADWHTIREARLELEHWTNAVTNYKTVLIQRSA